LKILWLSGSPRNDANSSKIADKFIKTAESLGAQVSRYELNRLNFKGCQGCCICKTREDRCIQKDGLAPVLAELESADMLVLSSPVYFGEMPGQVKCFIDRTFSFFVPDYFSNPVRSRLKPGKKLVMITAQGAPEGAFPDVPQKYINALSATLALGESYFIKSCGVGRGGIARNVPDKYLAEAEELAKKLCG
jgi:multimeric flavodoxin WrbA